MSDDLYDKCNRLIIAMVGERLAPMWWTGSNKRFDGETPEVVFKHSPDDVYKYLLNCAYGGW